MFRDTVKITWNSLLTVFGEEVEVTSYKGFDFKVEGVLSESVQEVEPVFSRASVREPFPRLKYIPSDYEIEVDDRLKVRGSTYRVVEKMPDNYGIIELKLKLVGASNEH